MNMWSSKILALSIIFLFIGVSFSSSVSVDTQSINVESEDDCGCNEVSDTDLILVERLLNRVEVYSKVLVVLSKHYPELREISEELSRIISISDLYNNNRPLCNILINILNLIDEMFGAVHNMTKIVIDLIPYGSTLYILMVTISDILLTSLTMIGEPVFVIAIILQCDIPWLF